MLEQIQKKETITLLGNEAIAYGLADGGIRYASAYPGTPSTEIMETLIKRFQSTMKAGWSANEAVALEEAASASIVGINSAIMLKSVGLNVAMDPLMTLALMGVKAALVIIVADDPGMHSSQNEQDNRFISKFSGIPMFEPSSIQECYDFAREAVAFSRKFEIPVFLRSVTRISHELGILELKPPVKYEEIPYVRDPSRFVSIPSNARKNKTNMIKLQKEMNKYIQEKKYYSEIKVGTGDEYLVVSSGSSSTYAIDTLNYFGFNALVFVPQLINPFPHERFIELTATYDKIIVIEELDPFLEEKIAVLAFKNKLNIEIIGRDEGITPEEGEITGDKLMHGISKYFKLPYDLPKEISSEYLELLKMRPPVLCPGCPHRSTYVLLQRVLKRENPIFSNDIGCYSLGFLPPHNTADSLIAMGASIPMATAIAETKPNNTAVAIIGDGTFWHSGVTGVANAVWKNVNLLIVIMDNLSTAMTGDQPNPSVDRLSIEETCRGMGAWVKVMDPMDYKDSIPEFKKVLDIKGVKVLIFRHVCAITEAKEVKVKGEVLPLATIIEENCNGCNLCIKPLGCPALSLNSDKKIAEIDPELCNGCMYCSEHCNRDAIKEILR